MDFSAFIIAAAALAVGIYIGRQSQKAALGSLVRTADRKASAADEANDRYLEVLQRELANIIARDNPDRMIALYRKAQAQEREMLKADKARVQAELAALTHKYPVYEDFDKIGTKHFVPYSGEPLWGEEGELSDAYLDISKFLILGRIQDGRSYRPVFPEDDEKSFRRCMQELKDQTFRASLNDAVDKYYLARRVAEQSDSQMHDYEDQQIGVFHLPSYADVRYGIHLKKTDEYGVYSFFVHDDGKISSRYARSDATFQNEIGLYL
ncbi:hypothetical protein SAMN05216330_10291 [Bradyrhizobium sp. Ghvi]|uniref:hypothetical protein n=1 Tax=Bradyrhizobium sp. Ghvi TaxID=1855319 RepID=UPI0008F236D9|nr:hypothetical protein [Bradyrhizobium sp. Ghvi]SFO17649.1 hypothetical protein SAMN05216330_10291 [Bradyrhizobium sp. Ghvi]